jgi:hypothetical protein
MKKPSRLSGQTLFLAAATGACVWTAGVMLDLPWLSEPWVRMFGRLAALWS